MLTNVENDLHGFSFTVLYTSMPSVNFVCSFNEISFLASPKYVLDGWEYRHLGPSFVPQQADVGKRVCVLLDLGPDTVMRCAVSEKPIAGRYDEPLIFEERQLRYCRERCAEG